MYRARTTRASFLLGPTQLYVFYDKFMKQGLAVSALRILFEDNHCIVVAKPARVLTASDKTGDETLLEMVRAYNAAQQVEGRKGYLVPLHFLDRPVSGIVLFARSSKAASRLSAQFREGRIEKVYNAIVEGPAPARSGLLEDYLLKDRKENVVTPVAPGTAGAKASRLSYEQLGVDRASGRTWLEIRPKTGRSHQIRTQLASRGMPIYGDRKYGALHGWDGVIALAAVAVTFEHPVTKAPVALRCPVPDYWFDIWPRGNDVQTT
jgi:23S rRNA pseudouridine1911/1915/1917 synthase